jgi:hypothetical protein
MNAAEMSVGTGHRARPRFVICIKMMRSAGFAVLNDVRRSDAAQHR